LEIFSLPVAVGREILLLVTLAGHINVSFVKLIARVTWATLNANLAALQACWAAVRLLVF